MAAAGQHDEPAVTDLDDDGLIVEDKRIGFPMVVVPGLLQREARLVAGGAIHFAGDKNGVFKEKAGLAFFDDGEASALQRGATGSRDLERIPTRNPHTAAIPEVGVNEHWQVGLA